jgi:surface antigen
MALRQLVCAATASAALAVAACSTAERPKNGVMPADTQFNGGRTLAVYDDTGIEYGDTTVSEFGGTKSGAERIPGIVAASRFLQCVPYARRESGIPIRGNAATWWRTAGGVFRRSTKPTLGAVMVFRASRRNPYGHLAVVRQTLGSRKVVVDHANWLNQGRIHNGTPVVDVSPSNDWSTVRVWYTPGNRLGAHVFPVLGFIYPEKFQPGELFQTIANANVRREPSRKARRIGRLPKRTTVEVLERVAGRPWFRVGRDGQELGYVFAPLVEPLS